MQRPEGTKALHAESNRISSIITNLVTSQVTQISVADLSPKDAIVAVMGPTGSGKSAFIEMATGITGIVGHSLESCTKDISVIKLSFPGITDSDICFVDTPGFDDVKKSDVHILKLISDWLNNTYKRQIRLTGLLYFHRISDNSMSGTPLKNLRVFEKLCGENFSNIVLTTTMWGEVEKEEGTTRERELKATFWGTMIERGSSVKRFLNTQESAFDVLAPIFDEVNRTNVLLLQEEMTDLRMQLIETSAGRALSLRFEDLVSRQQTLLGKIRRELKESKLDPDELHQLMEESGTLSEQLRRAAEDLKKETSIGQRIQQFSKTIDWTRLFSIIRRRPTGANVNAGREQPIVVSQQDQVSAQARELEEGSDPKKQKSTARPASGHTQDDLMNVEPQKESMVEVLRRKAVGDGNGMASKGGRK